MSRRTGFILIYVASAVFALGIGLWVFAYEGKEKDAAKKASEQLAAAMQANDPAAAPGKTADYVRGVDGYFGRVKSARFLEARKKTVGKAPQTVSFVVAELLLSTRRGAAVIELEFERNTANPDNDSIDSIRELEPDQVHSELDDETAASVKRGFAARGEKAAKPLVLDGTFTAGGAIREDDAPAPTARAKKSPKAVPDDPEVARRRRLATQQIECVRRAKGDVKKIQQCAQAGD